MGELVCGVEVDGVGALADNLDCDVATTRAIANIAPPIIPIKIEPEWIWLCAERANFFVELLTADVSFTLGHLMIVSKICFNKEPF